MNAVARILLFIGLLVLLGGGLVAMSISINWIAASSTVRELDGMNLAGGIGLFVLGLTMALGAAAIAVNTITGKTRASEDDGRRKLAA